MPAFSAVTIATGYAYEQSAMEIVVQTNRRACPHVVLILWHSKGSVRFIPWRVQNKFALLLI